MSQRNEALAVLKQARDAILARLTTTILEQSEDILADANGESFLSEIENLHDRLGNKLAHLNQMIANMPSEIEASHDDADQYFRQDGPIEIETERLPHFPMEVTLPEDVGKPADQGELIGLPAPGANVPSAPAFAQFVGLIEQGKTVEAGELIGQILSLSSLTGKRCAETFAARYQSDNGIVMKAMRIRHELVAGRYNDALMLIHECFGLQGVEAMVAMQKMQEILATSPGS